MLSLDEEKIIPFIEKKYMCEMNLKLCKRDMGGRYNSWVLCCQTDSSDVLEKNWIRIVDDAATLIQTELELAIERFNLYIVFFANFYVSSKLKALIEHDKYSSRKIVISEPMPELLSELDSRIEKLLFSIEAAYSQNCEANELEAWLEKDDKELYSLCLKYRENPQLISTHVAQYVSLFNK